MRKKLLTRLQSESRKTKRELSEQMKSSNFWTIALRTFCLIAFYYAASIGLTFYQKWLIKVMFLFILKCSISPIFSEASVSFNYCFVSFHNEIRSIWRLSSRIYSIHGFRSSDTWYVSYRTINLISFFFNLGWSQMLGRVGIVALVASLDIGKEYITVTG